MKTSLGAHTFALPTPVWVVGSYGENGEPNIMAAAWGGICCSSPPSLGVSLQKSRASYGNILRTKSFTISIPSQKHVVETDYVGIVSGKDNDKFSVTGLTPVRSEVVNAPYVEEFPLILECRLTHLFEIGVHTQFIGEIVDVKADEDVLGENGLPILAKVNSFTYSTTERAYYGSGEYLGQSHSVGLKLK
ncbi:MAG TPA: flavin reductase family protein [Methylomusa anaerophila]|uniref:Flavoredoxin n=1 Tax=Methylomusa anaerophila TaxID=1930071 RepID=A0A348AEP7_9FIRM|nr:flavin reductase family protein [Methylomusa anaerophila]BBB89545.1 flavoredoxin [Methylomusa anaerophila]HML90087.1 flavin reductase family protein [Methylomusa anaerophila]